MISASAEAKSSRTQNVTNVIVTSLVGNVIDTDMLQKSVPEDAVSSLESVASAEDRPDVVLCWSNSSNEFSEVEDQRKN